MRSPRQRGIGAMSLLIEGAVWLNCTVQQSDAKPLGDLKPRRSSDGIDCERDRQSKWR